MKHLFLWVACILAINTSISKAEENNTEISYCESLTAHKFAMETVREAYRRIGIDAKFTPRSCLRSLIEANRGMFSGDVARIQGASQDFSNLNATQFPALKIEGIAITNSVTRPITSIDDLKGLRIGIVRGELYTHKWTKSLNTHTATSSLQLVKMILKGRIDVAVVIKRDWDLLINTQEFADKSLTVIGPSLFREDLYHYVHNDHSHLLPVLNQTFKRMWETGHTARIHLEMMKELSHSPI